VEIGTLFDSDLTISSHLNRKMRVDRSSTSDLQWLGMISGEVFENFTSDRWLVDWIFKVEDNGAKVVGWEKM
jgi:hypothetical protein